MFSCAKTIPFSRTEKKTLGKHVHVVNLLKQTNFCGVIFLTGFFLSVSWGVAGAHHRQINLSSGFMLILTDIMHWLYKTKVTQFSVFLHCAFSRPAPVGPHRFTEGPGVLCQQAAHEKHTTSNLQSLVHLTYISLQGETRKENKHNFSCALMFAGKRLKRLTVKWFVSPSLPQNLLDFWQKILRLIMWHSKTCVSLRQLMFGILFMFGNSLLQTQTVAIETNFPPQMKRP